MEKILIALVNAVEYISETSGFDEDYVMHVILEISDDLIKEIKAYKEGL